MDETQHGRRTARCAGWASPAAYQKKDAGEPSASAVRRSLDAGLQSLYDSCPSSIDCLAYDDLNKAEKLHLHRSVVKLRLGSVNVGSLLKRSSEVAEMVGRRQLDFCCVQECKWKGQGARFLEGDGVRYKFFWAGCKEGTAGVGIMIAEKWIDKVVEVKRISARLMMLRITVGDKIVNVVSAYAPQVGRSYSEKEEFWDSMMDLVTGVGDEESIFIGGDLNGHVGQDVDGFEGTHGGNGYEKRNLEREMILEFARAMEMVVCNTLFKKEERKKVTYESGGNKSEVDYFMVRKLDKKIVKMLRL